MRQWLKENVDGWEWLIIAAILAFGFVVLWTWLGGPMPCFGAQCEGTYQP